MFKYIWTNYENLDFLVASNLLAETCIDTEVLLEICESVVVTRISSYYYMTLKVIILVLNMSK